MKTWILVLAAFVSSAALAAEVQLVRVTTDAIDGAIDMKLVVNADGAITAIKYVNSTTEQTFDIGQLPAGIVMFKYSGREVVKLYGKKFDPRNGGDIDVNYLANGVDGSRGDYWVSLVRQGQTWQMVRDDKAGRRSFTKMFMKARKVLGNTVGIQAITVSN